VGNLSGAQEAERTCPLAEAGKMRTALLSAVSHDLRTPLASARAAVDSLPIPASAGARTNAPNWSPPPKTPWSGLTGWSPTCWT
jgi:K+-sensing histidine kinase KdpD